MKLGITAKLAALLVLVGALAAGLTGFYANAASQDLLVWSAKNQLLTATQVLARRINLTREEASRNLLVLTRHPAAQAVLAKADATGGDELALLFALVMQANPAYTQIRLISASDYGLERVRADRTGATIVRVQGDDLQEKGHNAYVSEALKLRAGETYLSRISITRERGAHDGVDRPTLRLAMPVMSGDAGAIGVVVINVDLNGMFALLAADLPPQFKLFLANGSGDILIHPDSAKTFGFDKGRRVLVQNEFSATAGVVAGTQEQVVFDVGAVAGGTPMVAAFIGQQIEGPSEETRLILGLARPVADVLEQSVRLRDTIVQIVSGLCLACLLLAIPLARAFARPINAVSLAAQRIRSGLPPGELPLRRHDEIGSLARSFRDMQDQITRQLADLQASRNELEHLAQHDTLTGLPNRRLFAQRLEQALMHARGCGDRVSLLFIDLDGFKSVNDEFGHEAGDDVLRSVARRLTSAVRETDTVSRLGGDEFVVLIRSPAPQMHTAGVAETLLRALEEPIAFCGGTLQIGVSIGISHYPQDGRSANEIMASADRAMYAAKSSGRARFRFASTEAA